MQGEGHKGAASKPSMQKQPLIKPSGQKGLETLGGAGGCAQAGSEPKGHCAFQLNQKRQGGLQNITHVFQRDRSEMRNDPWLGRDLMRGGRASFCGHYFGLPSGAALVFIGHLARGCHSIAYEMP